MIASRAPENYVCPICVGVQGVENDQTLIKPADIVYEDEVVMALVNSFFAGQNKGGVIVIPKVHYESIYVLPGELGHRIFDVAKHLALAMKAAYKCDGITLRQNNEPAGDQHAFHFHLHVIPRYENDTYNTYTGKELADPAERRAFAQKLRTSLGVNKTVEGAL